MIPWAPKGLPGQSHFPGSAICSTHSLPQRLRTAPLHTCYPWQLSVVLAFLRLVVTTATGLCLLWFFSGTLAGPQSTKPQLPSMTAPILGPVLLLRLYFLCSLQRLQLCPRVPRPSCSPRPFHVFKTSITWETHTHCQVWLPGTALTPSRPQCQRSQQSNVFTLVVINSKYLSNYHAGVFISV